MDKTTNSRQMFPRDICSTHTDASESRLLSSSIQSCRVLATRPRHQERRQRRCTYAHRAQAPPGDRSAYLVWRYHGVQVQTVVLGLGLRPEVLQGPPVVRRV